MKNLLNILYFILSYLGINSLIYINNVQTNKFFIPSIFMFILFIFMFIFYKKYFNFKLYKKDKSMFWLFMIFSMFLAITYIIGYNLTVFDDSYINKIDTYFNIISLGLLFFTIFNCIYSKKDKLNKYLDKINIEKIDTFLFKKNTFLKCFILILLAWIPILLAFYPGVFSYDSSVQLNEYLNNSFSNNNPVFHTLIIGTCLVAGKGFFHSYVNGVLIYSILQMVVLAATLAYVIRYINKRKMPFIYKLVFLLIFMFLPSHSVMAITTTKDVFFSCLVVLVLIKVYDLVIYSDEFFEKKYTNMISLILLVSFLFIIRHNGMYGYLFLSVFLVIVMRKKLVPVLICIIAPFIIYSGYDKLINKYLLTSKFDNTNMTMDAALSIPLQQLGRVYNYANLTNEEKALFDDYKNKEDSEGFGSYQTRKGDAIKWSINPDKILNDKEPFINMYIKYAKKYPKLYTDAFLQMILGYFYVNDQVPDQDTYRTYIEIRCRYDLANVDDNIEFDSKIPVIHETYYNMLEKGTFQYLPIVSTFMCNAFYNLFMIFIIMLYLFKRKFKYVVPFMLMVGLMITNILGPVALFRYCYYLYIAFPIMVLSLYNFKKVK